VFFVDSKFRSKPAQGFTSPAEALYLKRAKDGRFGFSQMFALIVYVCRHVLKFATEPAELKLVPLNPHVSLEGAQKTTDR
jgi:hypothetical protein